ncbi:MAG TPA: hypothetical protein VNV44_00540 [Solirubrobacteraceae bacterium]|jgi:hypothetical protein|nr:hypothetical protein [Solirubrobacteraceae bacterium]
MRDPYTSLGEALVSAAHRQERSDRATSGFRAWLSRHARALIGAAIVTLSGGAVALAATGVLSGAPVKPEPRQSATAGNGLPVGGSNAGLVIAVSDPAGGLPWGARVFHTTRGQVCIQVGRVRDGKLGELGEDSAFGDDRRFHALPADALPPGYGGAAAQVECVSSGQTVIFEDANADRSGMRLIPEEFGAPGQRRVPPVSHRRALAYGLLGPHAVSVTYRTPAGLRTVPVSGRDGAFLIVQPPGTFKNSSLVGGSVGGRAQPDSVTVVMPNVGPQGPPLLSAATFRFGAGLCSQGSGAPVTRRCPQKPAPQSRRRYEPTRSLGAPVGLKLLLQSPRACRRAFLLTPCYRAEVTFTAPYAVTRAGADYTVDGAARCPVGGRPETGWGIERDIRRHELIRTASLGLFVYTARCAAHESFTVVYLNPEGPSRFAPHESVIVGKVKLSEAQLPHVRRTGG